MKEHDDSGTSVSKDRNPRHEAESEVIGSPETEAPRRSSVKIIGRLNLVLRLYYDDYQHDADHVKHHSQ